MKLYGEFSKTDWMKAANLKEEEIPQAFVIHGQWDFEENLQRWSTLLQQDIKQDGWNTIIGRYKSHRIGFSNVFGAPMAASSVHPYSIMGTEIFIQTGYFGGVSLEVAYGDILIVSAAEMADGVSRGYLPDRTFVEADSALIGAAKTFCESRGYPYKVGTLISIGNLHIETPQFVRSWSDKGHLGVDLETAATYAIAQSFSRRAISILNLADHICEGDTLFNYTDERRYLESDTDKRIEELALHLVTLQIE